MGCKREKRGWLEIFRKLKIHFREEGFQNLKTTPEKLKLYENPRKYRKHNKARTKQRTLNKLTQTRRIPSMEPILLMGYFPHDFGSSHN
jgi:hypothetical protein